MLPGQLYFLRMEIASDEKPLKFISFLSVNSNPNLSINRLISLKCSLNGGTTIFIVLSLKYKSCLKLFFSTSFFKSRFVAAIILTSVF